MGGLHLHEPLEVRRFLDALIAGRGVVVAVDDLVGIEAEVAGVLANETAGEDRSGKGLVIVSLDGFEETFADLGRVGDLLQRNAADLTLAPQLFPE